MPFNPFASGGGKPVSGKTPKPVAAKPAPEPTPQQAEANPWASRPQAQRPKPDPWDAKPAARAQDTPAMPEQGDMANPWASGAPKPASAPTQAASPQPASAGPWGNTARTPAAPSAPAPQAAQPSDGTDPWDSVFAQGARAREAARPKPQPTPTPAPDRPSAPASGWGDVFKRGAAARDGQPTPDPAPQPQKPTEAPRSAPQPKARQPQAPAPEVPQAPSQTPRKADDGMVSGTPDWGNVAAMFTNAGAGQTTGLGREVHRNEPEPAHGDTDDDWDDAPSEPKRRGLFGRGTEDTGDDGRDDSPSKPAKGSSRPEPEPDDGWGEEDGSPKPSKRSRRKPVRQADDDGWDDSAPESDDDGDGWEEDTPRKTKRGPFNRKPKPSDGWGTGDGWNDTSSARPSKPAPDDWDDSDAPEKTGKPKKHGGLFHRAKATQRDTSDWGSGDDWGNEPDSTRTMPTTKPDGNRDDSDDGADGTPHPRRVESQPEDEWADGMDTVEAMEAPRGKRRSKGNHGNGKAVGLILLIVIVLALVGAGAFGMVQSNVRKEHAEYCRQYNAAAAAFDEASKRLNAWGLKAEGDSPAKACPADNTEARDTTFFASRSTRQMTQASDRKAREAWKPTRRRLTDALKQYPKATPTTAGKARALADRIPGTPDDVKRMNGEADRLITRLKTEDTKARQPSGEELRKQEERRKQEEAQRKAQEEQARKDAEAKAQQEAQQQSQQQSQQQEAQQEARRRQQAQQRRRPDTPPRQRTRPRRQYQAPRRTTPSRPTAPGNPGNGWNVPGGGCTEGCL